MQRLTALYERTTNINLKLHPDKREFLKKGVSYPGHIVIENLSYNSTELNITSDQTQELRN